MDKTLRILIVEAGAADAQLLVDELREVNQPIQFERVATANDLTKALHNQWDIVLCNTSLPELNGMEALKIVKDNTDLPFIFISDTPDENAVVTAIRSGASDYISKNNVKRLILAVERALGEVRMQREQGFLQTQKMESLDQLTSGIAHDFNNLLMVIQCNLDILRMDLVGDEEHTMQIDQALEAVHAGADLIRKLIAFSRLQHLQPETINIPSALEKMARKTIGGLRGEETILIVEDEDNLRKLTAKYLESLGYQVLQAGDSAAALQTLQQTPSIVLLLTDIMIPGKLTGTALVDQAIKQNQDIKIVYMSGYPKEVLQSQYGINNEKYPLLLKPFSRFDLAILLRNILKVES